MISFSHVNYTYAGFKECALHDINLHIEKGSTVLLTGHSGSGKSTLLKLMNGLLLNEEDGQCSGEILIDNQNIEEMQMWQIAEKIGTVFQNPKSQFFNLDPEDEILFGLESRGISHEDMEAVLHKVSEDLQLSGLLNHGIFELSGGEKQLIAFASIYAMNPDIYLLDEPSGNLDAQGIENLRKAIIKIKHAGKTIVISEHRLWYAADLVDDVYFMDHGSISFQMKGSEFLLLSDEQRRFYGLRSIHPVYIQKEMRPISDRPVEDGLSLRNLSASYNRKSVWDGISFDVHEGHIYAITGSNGKGKSTLARILCGLKKASNGKIFWHGRRVKGRDLRKLGFIVMQDVNAQLFADSVLEEVMLDGEDEKRAVQSLDACNLSEYADRHPMTLSGGQKQRLAIADAMCIDKKIIIFDEPTSGMDYGHMMNFVKILHDLKDKKIILVITHDYEFIQESGASVLDWNKGNL